MKKYLYWCNECGWEARMDDHKYDFCPLCGHINISRHTAALYDKPTYEKTELTET